MPALKTENIAPLVHAVRGERVLFDADLAALYGVSTGALNQAVKRNRTQVMTASPYPTMMSQIVTSSRRKLRRLMDSNRQLARKIEALEKKYDEQFAVVFDAIKRLIAEESARKALPKRRIGFIS